jgi:hypothetical protein
VEIHLQMVYINKLTTEGTNLVDASNELVFFLLSTMVIRCLLSFFSWLVCVYIYMYTWISPTTMANSLKSFFRIPTPFARFTQWYQLILPVFVGQNRIVVLFCSTHTISFPAQTANVMLRNRLNLWLVALASLEISKNWVQLIYLDPQPISWYNFGVKLPTERIKHFASRFLGQQKVL